MATVICPQCGTANPAGSKFCSSCGISLTQQLRVSQPLPPPPASSPTGGQPARPPASPSGTQTTAQSTSPTALHNPATTTPNTIGLQAVGPGVTLQGGRYFIVRALGVGGMGSVFLARDTHVSNKPVVIKEMLNTFATEAERQEAEADFQAEATTLAGLAHPNIPAITDFFTESNRHFIVQAFIDGQDLQKALDIAGGKPLPDKQVLSAVSQVLSALDYLENQDPQVIHRDIKPANIIVDKSNRAWLVDFGVASHRFRPGSAASQSQQQSTPFGTPGYAPPEQFSGQETALSDLYALGATMHHLLTGRDPKQFISSKDLWVYPPPRQLNPKLPEGIARIIMRATQKEQSKRYQSAAAMKKDVDAILMPRGALSTVRGKAIALLIVLLLLLIAVVGALVYARQQSLIPATGFVSEGAIAFDVQADGRSGTALDVKSWAADKRTASVDFKNGNKDQASSEYAAATTNDRTDAESWIYQENIAVEASDSQPYYIAVGGSFSGANVFTGRQLLQGAYTAQKEINDAGGVNGHKIVLVLANDASSADGALQSARKVAADQRVLAMIGYSFSSRTAAALPPLTAAQIPLISPTASSPNLNGPANFFRVCPSDSYQGQQDALYMLNTLLAGKHNPLIAVFSDPNDAYSSELGVIVAQTAQAGGARILNEDYTIGSTTVQDFQTPINQLVAQKADLIYFAGYTHEALFLARELDALNVPQSLAIMSDDAFYNPQEFIAQPGHKGRFHFTGFFFPDEAGLTGNATAQTRITQMANEYTANFHRADVPLGQYGSSRVSSDTAMAYDALYVVKTALQNVGGHPTRAQLRDAIAAIGSSKPAYQGISGRIAFDAQGNPSNKALLVMHLDINGHTRMDKFLGSYM